jgi:TonB family protein
VVATSALAQLHGRFRIEVRGASREVRAALVGVPTQIEAALARCAPHTAGQPSATLVTLGFTSAGQLRSLRAAPLEGEPAPSDALRTCIESTIHRATLPAIGARTLELVVRFTPPERSHDVTVERAERAAEYPGESVRRVVHEHTAAVRRCYEGIVAAHDDAHGTLTVRFTIDAQGRVTEARAETDEPAVPALTECILAALRGWSFPAPASGASAELTYPFVFQSHE